MPADRDVTKPDEELRRIAERHFGALSTRSLTVSLEALSEAFALGCRMQREADQQRLVEAALTAAGGGTVTIDGEFPLVSDEQSLTLDDEGERR